MNKCKGLVIEKIVHCKTHLQLLIKLKHMGFFKHSYLTLMLFCFCNFHAYSQDTIQEDSAKLKILRQEYSKIKLHISNYTVKEAHSYDNQYSFENRLYKGYFDASGNLIMLTFYLVDDGYGTKYEYYFKGGQCFFIFRENDWEPINENSQEFVYIYNEDVISFLIKKKEYKDETPFASVKTELVKKFDKDEYTFRPNKEKERFIQLLKK